MLYYGWSFNGLNAHCNEGYVNAEACFSHLDLVGPTVTKALEISTIEYCEITGPELEVAKLNKRLGGNNKTFDTFKGVFNEI